MKPEPSTLSTPHKSNDVSHSKTPEDIALDKQILRSQIRPQRLIAKNARTAAEHEQMKQQYRDHILSLIPKDAQAQTIAAYLPTASEPPITAALHDLHAHAHPTPVPRARPAFGVVCSAGGGMMGQPSSSTAGLTKMRSKKTWLSSFFR